MQRVAPDYCNLTCRPVPAVYGHLEPAKRSIGELLGGEEERWHQFVYLSIHCPQFLSSCCMASCSHYQSESGMSGIHRIGFNIPSFIYRRSLSLCLSVPFSVQRACLCAPCVPAIRSSDSGRPRRLSHAAGKSSLLLYCDKAAPYHTLYPIPSSSIPFLAFSVPPPRGIAPTPQARWRRI
jgi:hypothetical protein